MKNKIIALLGQPNSGKSTLFNGLTGSRQHVGNWPGKTVEQKEGYFTYNNNNYTIVDLPGTYSLSANSDEEIVTREYIASQKADLVCIMADASQLERSLFMLADYAGIKTPIVLVLNMMDVANDQGKSIDSVAISKQLGVAVVPLSAANTKGYDAFYSALEKSEKNPKTLNESEISKLYSLMVGDAYNKVVELLPKDGVAAYSSTWLAAKLLEEDKPAMDIVKSAINTEDFAYLSETLEEVVNGSLLTGECKFKWIENILKNNVKTSGKTKPVMGKFDKLATSKMWGKAVAIGIIILGLILSMVIAMPFMGFFGAAPRYIITPISNALTSIHTPAILVSLLGDAIITAVSFAFMMTSFVFGVSLVFGLLEEIGYMARISYVFDNTMSKLGLQGKAVMPFLISFGCNIGGVSGTRVIDSWGQRVTTMALSWVVPCAATWGVVGLISSTFFGNGAPLVIVSLFIVAMIHMVITSKIFGKALISDSDKTGLIMELPPYHKPKYKNLFKFVFNRMGDIIKRSLKTIIFVSVIFWFLAYTPSGNVENSIIYKIGTFIEPVTMWFGLRWQLFIAFLSAAMGKEAALGVLSSLFDSSGGTSGVWVAISAQKSAVNAGIAGTLLGSISKPEALAFIYAFFFNIPCLMAVASTYQESHSLKWTLRIVAYYIIVALIMSFLAYHVGLLIF